MAHTTFGAKADGTPYIVELGANWVRSLDHTSIRVDAVSASSDCIIGTRLSEPWRTGEPDMGAGMGEPFFES